MRTINIREYQASDAVALADLFFDSVRNGTSQHYTEAQRHAWAPAPPDKLTWHNRLSRMRTLVAEDAGAVVGFMAIEPDGHIDFAYVRADLIGHGVGHQLYVKIEELARQENMKVLYTEASHLARPFFDKHGWALVETQQVERFDVLLTNHRMQKVLWPWS